MDKIRIKAVELLDRASILMLSTIDAHGFPRSVAMAKVANQGEIIYFASKKGAEKMKHLFVEPKAGVSLTQEHDCLAYVGEISVVEDMSIKRMLWKEWMEPHYRQGVEDPDFCLLRFTPKGATLLVGGEFARYSAVDFE